MLQKNGDRKLEAYTNANWRGSIIDRQSTTRYCAFLGGNLVTWRSKKQSVVARSSTQESLELWIKAFLSYFGSK